MGYTKMELDSNGLLLARNPRLAIELQVAGLTCVYLQMDGLAAAVNEFIRGCDLRAEKLQAIAHCRDAGLQVVLAVTLVPGVNDESIWSDAEHSRESSTGEPFEYPGSDQTRRRLQGQGHPIRRNSRNRHLRKADCRQQVLVTEVG